MINPVILWVGPVHHSLPMSQAHPPSGPSKQGTPAHGPQTEHFSCVISSPPHRDPSHRGAHEGWKRRKDLPKVKPREGRAGRARCRPQGFALKAAFSEMKLPSRDCRAGSHSPAAGPCCTPNPHTLGSGAGGAPIAQELQCAPCGMKGSFSATRGHPSSFQAQVGSLPQPDRH